MQMGAAGGHQDRREACVELSARRPGRRTLASSVEASSVATASASAWSWGAGTSGRRGALTAVAACNEPSELLAGALAYVERYDGDVLQLELERDLLARALAVAWRHADHGAVIRLVARLAQIAARFHSFAEAERILRLGIESARQSGDRLALARFLNRLGGLLQARGRFAEAGRLWHASLALAGPPASAIGLWDPIASF